MVYLTKRTPAKINLCLLVGPRNDEGNHNIFTVFVPVDLYDELEFELEPRPDGEGPGTLRVECKLAAGEANLATQALRALEQHTGWSFNGRIVIHKRIPVGAGLGGGSSDAAAALLAGCQTLDEAGGPVLETTELIGLARRLGADVAFFLDPFPAFGRGIGEILEPFELPEFSIVLVFFDRMLSTARVYRTFDNIQPAATKAMWEFRTNQAEKRWRQVAEVGQIARLLENDLELASFNLIPTLATDREILIREGAIGALMSGSGPTLFGLCSTPEKALELKERLGVRGYRAEVARVAVEPE